MTPTETTPGLGVDKSGNPVIDPTANVIALVQAGLARQDDLRDAASLHLKEMMSLRAEYDEKLRKAESARIDAIRAVDVGAVNRAAEVSAAQALTLATQVATSADTLRTQVATTQVAAQTALAAALEPIQKDIADLRRVQYEAAGGKSATVETVDSRRASTNTYTNIITAVVIAIGAVVTAVIAIHG